MCLCKAEPRQAGIYWGVQDNAIEKCLPRARYFWSFQGRDFGRKCWYKDRFWNCSESQCKWDYPGTQSLFGTAYQLKGLAGLDDSPKSGRSVIYDKVFKDLVLKKISESPPAGYSRWDAPLLAKELNSSVDAIWRLLKKDGIHLNRQRSWCITQTRNLRPRLPISLGYT